MDFRTDGVQYFLYPVTIGYILFNGNLTTKFEFPHPNPKASIPPTIEKRKNISESDENLKQNTK